MRGNRGRRLTAAVGSVALAAAAVAIRMPAAGAGTAVVVQATGGSEVAGAAVRRAGGTVTRPLDVVGGVAASVPTGRLGRLAATPGIAVTPDEHLRVQGTAPGDGGTSVYRDVVGAGALVGNRGDGVTVAVLDTGIAPVPDLAGRVLPVYDDLRRTTAPCLDLSGEGDCADRYGHGTFMAGIIAGDGTASGGRYVGVAPGARLVSLKVAGRDGASDVSTVLAAIQWAVSFKDRYGIRVLNLSLGTDSTQSYRSDPLDYAVERAWAAGIAVVVAASNRGPFQRTISKPGDDPWVITVGAVDDRGTVASDDDRLPDFTSRGPTAADGLGKPDLAAPGAHLVSTSSPGSEIATNFPSSVGAGYQVGSGTSMATAVVSGVAALLVKADPFVTPDRLKYQLTSAARPGPVNDPMAVGAGVVDAGAALTAGPGLANRYLARSDGMGSLDLSRGNLRVQTLDPAGVVVSGTQTAQLVAWNSFSFLGLWWGLTWYLSTPYLFTWEAVTWEGSKWQGSKWQGSKWQGGADPASTYGSKWQGSDWYGAWG